jgi:hypothetical protein
MAAGTVVRLRSMQTAKYNHVLATMLPPSVDMPEGRTAVAALVSPEDTESVRHEGVKGLRMSVRTECLRPARPLGGEGARMLEHGCAHERVITRALGQWGLPPDCAAAVLAQLHILPVEPDRVAAVACSSQANADPRGGSYTFTMQATLEPGDDDCWISAQDVALHTDDAYAKLLQADAPGSETAFQFDEWIVYHLDMMQLYNLAAQPEPAAADPRQKQIWKSAAEADMAAAEEAEAEAPQPARLRQLHRVSMRIPPLPHGPLSVRRFYLQGGRSTTANAPRRSWNKQDRAEPDPLAAQQPQHKTLGWEWGQRSAVFTTLDAPRLQHFAVYPPLEAEAVRLVCVENAAGVDLMGSQHGSIGFWEIAFA